MLDTIMNMPANLVYEIGKLFAFYLFYGVAAIASLWFLVASFRFAYFYYIKTGRVFFGSPHGQYSKEIEPILNQKLVVLDIGIAQAWVAVLLLFLVATFASLVWPVAIAALVLFGIPYGSILLLGYRRRKKEEFIQALKRVEDDEV